MPPRRQCCWSSASTGPRDELPMVRWGPSRTASPFTRTALWWSSHAPPTTGPKPPREVVVGWIDTVSAWWAFNAAVEAAVARHGPLTVLRVQPMSRQEEEPWIGDQPLLDAISSAEPPCPPSLLIRISHEVTDDPAAALIRAADAADLLVIGCHHSVDQWSVRTGPVAEAVMRGASCPVMLVSQPVAAPQSRRPARPASNGAR